MIEIIPAIDIIDGKCVRLSQGDYSSKKIYNENPLEVAKQFEDAGIKRLHLVDLDGAKSKTIVNHKTLENITSKTSLIVDFGGGLKSNNDLKIAFDCGAQMITGGSIAVKDSKIFTQWLSMYGGGKIILGADVKNEKIAVTGWLEDSGIEMWQFIADYMAKGVTKVICTDISKDGMLQGPSTELYVSMKKRFADLFVIASGGISCIKDVEILHDKGIDAVIIGKAIYENKISMKDLQAFL
jgi:phosphoribosylformimino-5-aminoimidazole carboxamide ribotide isomerase